jgi:hypothetical protein
MVSTQGDVHFLDVSYALPSDHNDTSPGGSDGALW